MLFTAALIGAGAVAVNMFLNSRAKANGGTEPMLFGLPVRSIGLAVGLLAPLVLGGPLGLLAVAFGLGSAWPLLVPSWGGPPQIPGAPPAPQFQPPPQY